jgi:hypothetical protein
MDLRALFADLARLAITAGSARRGRFVATVERGKLTVQPAGVRPVSDDAADLLRAVCGAVWAAVDRGEHVEDVGAVLAAAGWPVPVFADPTY